MENTIIGLHSTMVGLGRISAVLRSMPGPGLHSTMVGLGLQVYPSIPTPYPGLHSTMVGLGPTGCILSACRVDLFTFHYGWIRTFAGYPERKFPTGLHSTMVGLGPRHRVY